MTNNNNNNQRMRVRVLSKLTAVSSRPTGPGHTHPFTALDHAMGLHSLHIIYYYRDNVFRHFDLDPSRVSLSEVLSLYPPVTGRLVRDGNGNWQVKCNDAGVRVIRARVGTTLDEWLTSADGLEEKDLAVWDDMPDDPNTWSPFRVQINEFEGGGIAIGLSCTHMHADLTCATLLLNSWTQTHRSQSVTHPPVYSSSFTPPTNSDGPRLTNQSRTKSASFYANKSNHALTQPSSAQMGTATFRFSHAAIEQSLALVHDECPDATPFDLLAALFWTRVERLKATKHGRKERSISVCVDFRQRLRPPLPLGYYGNALHFSPLSLDSEEMDSGGLGHVVERVHHHVSSLEAEDFRSVMEWFESRKEGVGGRVNKLAPPFRMYGPELTCVNMEHMIDGPNEPTGKSGGPLMYGARFDEESGPVHVSYHVGNAEGEGLIVVMPACPDKEEGVLGRTVMVAMPHMKLAELCEDQAVLRLQPTMLLSSKYSTT